MSVSKKAKELARLYTYRVFWSEEDQEFVGTCLEFPSLSALAKDQVEALKEIDSVVATVVADMLKDGETLPEAISKQKFKGNMSLRTTPEKHRELVIKAAEAGVSVNQYILSKIG